MEDTRFLSGSGLNISDEVNGSTHQVNLTSSSEEIALRYFNSALMLLFFLIGLPWNIMVIGIILKKKLYSQPSLILLLNLAVANLFILLTNTPLIVIVTIGHQFVDFGYFAPTCKATVVIMLFPLVSAHTIAMMSVDRVIYLKKPLTYHLIVTPWRMLIAIAVMWIFSIAVVLPIIETSLGLHNEDSCTGLVSKVWVNTLILADFILATLVQFVGCGCIIFITRTHLRKKLHRTLNNSLVRNGGNPTDTRRRSAVLKDYSKDQLRLIFVFGAIFVTDLLSLIPLVSIFAVSAIIGYDPPSYVFATFYIIYLSRSPINPILEVSLTHEIRSALCKLCTTCVNFKRPVPATPA